jgi:hypothetical protein
MAIIDPDGLFFGERLAACSDLAQLYWPRFFLAANGCGRLELAYKSLISRVFANFKNIPESSEIWAIFREYEANYLAVIYESVSGGWWCQFITPEKCLPKFKTARDKRTPEPPLEFLEAAQKGYLQWKKDKSIKNMTFQKISEISEKFPIGVGVGIGVGEGVGISDANASSGPAPRDPTSNHAQKKSTSSAKKTRARDKQPLKKKTKTDLADERYVSFKEAIRAYWDHKNPNLPLIWGKEEGQNLGIWLRQASTVTLDQFRQMLRNRAKSEVGHGDRPMKWILQITSFANGPLDRFNKPLEGGKPNGRSNPQSKQDATVDAVKKAIAGIRQVDHVGTGEDRGGDEGAGEFGVSLFHDR